MAKMKYHIKANGLPGPCRATSRPCPLGGADTHFNSMEEAQAYAEKLNGENYGLLQTLSHQDTFNQASSDPNSLMNKVLEVSDTKVRGYQYECYGASQLAEAEGLDKAIVFTEDGVQTVNDDGNMRFELHERATNLLANHYKKHGIEIDDKYALARVIYYSNDNDTLVVQSGGPNVLDAATIHANGDVDVVEIKKTHDGGAQIKSQVLELDGFGNIIGSQNFDPRLQAELKKMNVSDADGTNVSVKIPKDVATEHFINEYKRKGATTLLCTDHNGALVHQDISGPTEEVARRLNDVYDIDLKLRANYGAQNMNSVAYDRFELSEDKYFKVDVPLGPTFNLGDVKREELKPCADGTKMGEFIIPIPFDKLRKESDDFVITKNTLRYYPLTLTGTIKLK